MKVNQTYLYIFCVGSLFYIGAVIFYRLVLSPLAQFPGPRLAAATRLYEVYFQIVKGGTFTWHINDLHDRYGPVVRITPWELHIRDPQFYNTLYAGPGKHRNKDPLFSFIGYPKSIFSLNSYDSHRRWRKILGQFLKKNAVLEFEPVIRENTQKLCKHFSTAVNASTVIELNCAFHCFTSDTLSQHAFGKTLAFNYLDRPQLSESWKKKVNTMFEFCRVVRHFNFIADIAHLIPKVVSLLVRGYDDVYSMEQATRSRIQRLIEDFDEREADAQRASNVITKPFFEMPKAIYPAILANPDVPLLEKSQSRLEDDAIFLMFAGTDAPSQTIAITMFHILNNPRVYQKLKNELFAAIPDITAAPSLDQLEKISYLSATIREGLRIASVVTTRLPRSAPDEILQYQQWEIPAGTFVSMSTFFILRDPNIFPEPENFTPERWLLEPDELQQLERYLVPASKGTLGCLGQNMNWSWSHYLIGYLVRRFDMVLYETTELNVKMVRDNFIGQTGAGLNNVQVRVLKEHS